MMFWVIVIVRSFRKIVKASYDVHELPFVPSAGEELQPEVEDVFEFMHRPMDASNTDADSDVHKSTFNSDNTLCNGQRHLPPTISAYKTALSDLNEILHSHCKNRMGHLPFDGDELLRKCLDIMRMFLWTYVNQKNPCT